MELATNLEVSRIFRSLRVQLSISILLMAFITVGLITMVSNWVINREFENYVMQQEKKRSADIIDDLTKGYVSHGGWSNDFLHTIGMYSLYDGYILKIYSSNGKILWDAENHDMLLCEKIMGEISQRMTDVKKSGDFVTSDYGIQANGNRVGEVSITYYGPFFYTENDYLFIKTLNTVLLIIALLSALFSIIAGTLLAKRLSQPITKTAYIASQISQGNYEIRFENTPRIRELEDMVNSINQLADALSEKDNLRKRLTSDVAHELRTPLASVAAHLEAMIEGIWEATPERLQSCYDEVKRIGTLVADLQQLENTENQNLQLHYSEIDMLKLLNKVCEIFEAEANMKKINISAAGENVIVNADRDRISQVMINLVSNGVKYTSECGKISIDIIDNGEFCIIKITDTGSGISKEDLPHIFKRFYRTDKSRNRKTGGTGIGLTIAKSIVEAHGGSIEVESRVGKGSCFTVIIPKHNKA